MSCCGKKRDAIQQQLRRTPTVSSRPAAPSSTHRMAPVVFKGTGAYLVAGPYTREVYHFSAQSPEQWVDANDAEGLIRTGLFEAARARAL
jgi:hypothetical protein